MALPSTLASRAQSRASNEPMVLGVVGFLTAVSLLAVSLRLYVRQFVLKTVGLDDGFIIISMVRLEFLFAVTTAQVPRDILILASSWLASVDWCVSLAVHETDSAIILTILAFQKS